MSTSVRMVIVANELPLEADQRDDKSWSFSWDKDSLFFQLKDGFPDKMIVFHVGRLKANNIPEHEQQEVSKKLLDELLCIPTFLPPEILNKFYNRFCKGYLWPLFHSMEPFGGSINIPVRPFWDAYVSANRSFSQKVMEVCNPEGDYIWIHDYHLMVLPSFLREKYVRMKIGFFLHIPFPSFETYRTLIVREEILESLLNCDVIGFHNYDYARNFLSCCSRILGLKHKLDKGFLELEYYGRNIRIKVMPVGIDMDRIEPVMRKVEGEFQERTGEHLVGKTVLLSIDDIDIYKGIELKMLAMEHMLKQHQEEQGKAVLVQILNPARDQGIPYDNILCRIREICERINKTYEQPGYKPIYLLEHQVCTIERFAYYSIAECLVVTPFKDGMNLYPYEYTACRQWITGLGSSVSSHVPLRKSMVVISEFTGCSLSLCGALRVNPWDGEELSMKMYNAISMDDALKQIRHRNNYKHISKHDVVHWSTSFYKDMVRTWENQSWRAFSGVDSGLHFTVVSVDPRFEKLPIDTMTSDYKKAKTRAILLDYDGTLIPINSVDKSPSEDLISTLNYLCNDKGNVVFVVSGRGKDNLSEWFKSCKNLGIAAEHGFFLRWPGNEEWETFGQSSDMHWKGVADHIMEFYTSVIDGSYIERKEYALVWNYQNADLGFASSQAKELLDHLEDILANDPVTVKSGKFIVQVESQGVNKGTVAKRILESMVKKEEKGDKFILSIGDDQSDEDMFEILNATVEDNLSSPNPVFTCTIGPKLTKAKYYLKDTFEVINVLEQLGVYLFLDH